MQGKTRNSYDRPDIKVNQLAEDASVTVEPMYPVQELLDYVSTRVSADVSDWTILKEAVARFPILDSSTATQVLGVSEETSAGKSGSTSDDDPFSDYRHLQRLCTVIVTDGRSVDQFPKSLQEFAAARDIKLSSGAMSMLENDDPAHSLRVARIIHRLNGELIKQKRVEMLNSGMKVETIDTQGAILFSLAASFGGIIAGAVFYYVWRVIFCKTANPNGSFLVPNFDPEIGVGSVIADMSPEYDQKL